jgi:N-acetylmuramoyl-L-alanine amidase
VIKVIIDPGHGGPSNPPKVGGSSWNNAVGPTGLLEKTVTLQVAQAAKRSLDTSRVAVSLTRATDINLGIVARAKVAKDVRAEVFVSIHFNAAPAGGPPAQGTETWIGNNPTTKSRQLATAIQQAVVAVTQVRNRGVKSGAVSGVINNAHHHPDTAHCLVEISFLDRQPAEEVRLRSQAYIDQLGTAVRDGILSYLRDAGLIEDHEEMLASTAEPADAVEAYAAGLVSVDGGAKNLSEERDGAGEPSFGILPDPPLVGDRRTNTPFADIAGEASVDDPTAVLRGFAEARVLEAQVAEWNTVQASLLAVLGQSRRSVARIVVPPGDYQDYVGRPAFNGWTGTGFLVGDNLLLTNHHVLNSPEVARAASAEFGYEVTAEDLSAGRMNGPRPVKRFKLDPQRLFVTSPATGTGLDFTFVWIEDIAAREFGLIRMERASFTASRYDPVFIVHHPQGRVKEASLDDTEVLRIQATVIHYAADTDYGSSGAPVFDRNGRLIGLHHARNSDSREALQDGRYTDVLNEGIKIAAIAIDLENRVRRGQSDDRMAQIVLANMAGSDTLTGFFGALGRDAEGSSAVEAVVNVYTGTEQDVDVGFWNIEWLANRYHDHAKLEGAATVIVDLNLDIWCLSEVSPPAVVALVETLYRKFGEVFDYALSEPDAAEGKQSTAVIWKPSLVSGERIEWPEPIRGWWTLDSRDDLPFEAVDGKIFNRYPGLFHFTVKGRERLAPFDFYLVPLHLKAMAEGSKRRRLASMLLARAIEKMTADGEDSDWIIGGDVNDDLASGDFDALTDAGLVAMSAADETAGAFTYLKSPKSLIDNIFLSPNLHSTAGNTDYFIVAKEQSMDKFVKRVSDHRPVVLRVSLANGTPRAPASEVDLQEIVNLIVHRGSAPPVRRRTTRPQRSN